MGVPSGGMEVYGQEKGVRDPCFLGGRRMDEDRVMGCKVEVD